MPRDSEPIIPDDEIPPDEDRVIRAVLRRVPGLRDELQAVLDMKGRPPTAGFYVTPLGIAAVELMNGKLTPVRLSELMHKQKAAWRQAWHREVLVALGLVTKITGTTDTT